MRHTGTLAFALAASLAPALALAQGADLDEEAATIEADVKPAEDGEKNHPFPKLLASVEKSRAEIQKLINDVNARLTDFPDLEKEVNRVSTAYMKLEDQFHEKNAELLAKIREAESGPPADLLKLTTELQKHLTTIDTGLQNIKKRQVPSLQKQYDLLKAKWEAQQAEEAADEEGK